VEMRTHVATARAKSKSVLEELNPASVESWMKSRIMSLP
jgi:hypothetical protein